MALQFSPRHSALPEYSPRIMAKPKPNQDVKEMALAVVNILINRLDESGPGLFATTTEQRIGTAVEELVTLFSNSQLSGGAGYEAEKEKFLDAFTEDIDRMPRLGSGTDLDFTAISDVYESFPLDEIIARIQSAPDSEITLAQKDHFIQLAQDVSSRLEQTLEVMAFAGDAKGGLSITNYKEVLKVLKEESQRLQQHPARIESRSRHDKFAAVVKKQKEQYKEGVSIHRPKPTENKARPMKSTLRRRILAPVTTTVEPPVLEPQLAIPLAESLRTSTDRASTDTASTGRSSTDLAHELPPEPVREGSPLPLRQVSATPRPHTPSVEKPVPSPERPLRIDDDSSPELTQWLPSSGSAFSLTIRPEPDEDDTQGAIAAEPARAVELPPARQILGFGIKNLGQSCAYSSILTFISYSGILDNVLTQPRQAITQDEQREANELQTFLRHLVTAYRNGDRLEANRLAAETFNTFSAIVTAREERRIEGLREQLVLEGQSAGQIEQRIQGRRAAGEGFDPYQTEDMGTYMNKFMDILNVRNTTPEAAVMDPFSNTLDSFLEGGAQLPLPDPNALDFPVLPDTDPDSVLFKYERTLREANVPGGHTRTVTCRALQLINLEAAPDAYPVGINLEQALFPQYQVEDGIHRVELPIVMPQRLNISINRLVPSAEGTRKIVANIQHDNGIVTIKGVQYRVTATATHLGDEHAHITAQAFDPTAGDEGAYKRYENLAEGDAFDPTAHQAMEAISQAGILTLERV